MTLASHRKLGYEDAFFGLMPFLGLYIGLGRGGVFGWGLCAAVCLTCAFQMGKMRSEKIAWSTEAIEHSRWGRVVARFPLDGTSSLFDKEVPGPEPWIIPVRRHGVFLMDTLSMKDETKYIRLYPSYYTRQDDWKDFLLHAVTEGRLVAKPSSLDLLAQL
jgi:hypothetical protein